MPSRLVSRSDLGKKVVHLPFPAATAVIIYEGFHDGSEVIRARVHNASRMRLTFPAAKRGRFKPKIAPHGQYNYKGQNYQVERELLLKHPVLRTWVPAVQYRPTVSGGGSQFFVRERSEFLDRFKPGWV